MDSSLTSSLSSKPPAQCCASSDPNSPDFNPIENTLSKLKASLHKAGELLLQAGRWRLSLGGGHSRSCAPYMCPISEWSKAHSVQAGELMACKN